MSDSIPPLMLKGMGHAVVLPRDYSLIQEAAQAVRAAKKDTVRCLQVASALVLICCPVVGRKARQSDPGLGYEAHDYSMVSFGRAAFSWLHAQGATQDEIVAAFTALVPPLMALSYPSDAEVADAMGKSPASAEP